MELSVAYQLIVAVALGLLVGLQRQRAESLVAGIRTFPIIAMLGVFCGVLGSAIGTWVVAAGLIGLAALTVMANYLRAGGGRFDPGAFGAKG